jgi:hypothetical protein
MEAKRLVTNGSHTEAGGLADRLIWSSLQIELRIIRSLSWRLVRTGRMAARRLDKNGSHTEADGLADILIWTRLAIKKNRPNKPAQYTPKNSTSKRFFCVLLGFFKTDF